MALRFFERLGGNIVRFRLYQPEDFMQLYEIEKACFQPLFRFGRLYMRQLIDSSSSATWIATEDGVMAGFAIVEWSADAEGISAYIQTIEVAPASRRRGIGSGLLRQVEISAQQAGCNAIRLHVDEHNEGAAYLYRTEGYKKEGRHEDYYARHRAADIYCKTLGPDVQ